MIPLFFFFLLSLYLFIYEKHSIYFSVSDINRHQEATFTNMVTLRPNKKEIKGRKIIERKSQITNQ